MTPSLQPQPMPCGPWPLAMRPTRQPSEKPGRCPCLLSFWAARQVAPACPFCDSARAALLRQPGQIAALLSCCSAVLWFHIGHAFAVLLAFMLQFCLMGQQLAVACLYPLALRQWRLILASHAVLHLCGMPVTQQMPPVDAHDNNMTCIPPADRTAG